MFCIYSYSQCKRARVAVIYSTSSRQLTDKCVSLRQMHIKVRIPTVTNTATPLLVKVLPKNIPKWLSFGRDVSQSQYLSSCKQMINRTTRIMQQILMKSLNKCFNRLTSTPLLFLFKGSLLFNINGCTGELLLELGELITAFTPVLPPLVQLSRKQQIKVD